MNSSIWKVNHAKFYEDDKLNMNAIICMLILLVYMSLYGICSPVVPSGRLEFDQPCLNVYNVRQKQQGIAKILFEITSLTIHIPMPLWISLQYIL